LDGCLRYDLRVKGSLGDPSAAGGDIRWPGGKEHQTPCAGAGANRGICGPHRTREGL